VSLAHLVTRDLFGYTLPARLQTYELVRDREHFELVPDPARLQAGDLVWFGLAEPPVSLEEFEPQYNGDELLNWRDLPVKHVAISTGAREHGDPLLLHASLIAGTNVLWPGHQRALAAEAIPGLRPVPAHLRDPAGPAGVPAPATGPRALAAG
jgi:hypothetical protein